MKAGQEQRPTLALVGNPNSGKTTLFNRLTGARQRVGNYPGITVDRHTGTTRLGSSTEAEVVDIPGCYSLAARSPEEQIALWELTGIRGGEPPTLAIVVVDATQLAKNLYLALQVLELGFPAVVALNMMDMVEAAGDEIDTARLEEVLGVPVVPIRARQGQGLETLLGRVEEVLQKPSKACPGARVPLEDPLLQADLDAVAECLPESWVQGDSARTTALARWALLSLQGEHELEDIPEALETMAAKRCQLAEASKRDTDLELIAAQYEWIERHCLPCLRSQKDRTSWSERVDRLLLQPVLGWTFLLVVMGLLFQTLFAWSGPMIDWIDGGFGSLSGWVSTNMSEGLLRDFLTEGLIAGTGAVLVFLPQILLLFLFLGIMEDSGYMARVAFLMDRLMKLLGLHGRAFIPMLSGYACAIPAVMATRTMERRRDRLLTMMVVPLMSCAARLPVYTLIIGALFPVAENAGFIDTQGLLMVGMYLFSTLVALVAAGVLSRTLLRGPHVPLILELPPYRLPQPGAVVREMWEKGKVFVTEAGTVILACTVVLWVLLAFPSLPADQEAAFAQEIVDVEGSGLTDEALESAVAEVEQEASARQRQHSYAGRLGQAMEPLIEPLGFDWKIGIGLIGSFAAREVFVATMGVVYGSGDGDDEVSVASLRSKMKAEVRDNGRPLYTPLVGISLLIFFALACQCLSTVAVVKRETAGWRWPLFMVGYMTALAWVASFIVYQGGRLLGYE